MAIVDRINRSIESFSDEYGELLVKNLKRSLVDEGKYNTGTLVDTMYYDVKVNEDGKSVINITAEDYLRYVDKGRRPGRFPPIRKISKWASSKGISQRYVFPIARKIAEKGIKATNVVKKSIEKTNREFLPQYESQLSKLVGVVLVNDIFNKTTTQGKIVPKNLR